MGKLLKQRAKLYSFFIESICIGDYTFHSARTFGICFLNPLNDDKSDESWGVREIEILIERCSSSCKKCSTLGVTICSECYPNAILTSNTCKCRDGFFMERVSSLNEKDCSFCKLCSIECKTCSSKSICLSCRDGYTLNGDQCVLDGSKGEYLFKFSVFC